MREKLVEKGFGWLYFDKKKLILMLKCSWRKIVFHFNYTEKGRMVLCKTLLILLLTFF
jgi:hypothetical protein